MKRLLGFLIIVGIIGLAVYYFYLTYIHPPQRDYAAKANQLEQEVDALLVSKKIDTASIIKMYREEKKQAENVWIYTYKEIRFPVDESFESIMSNVRSLCAKLGTKLIKMKKDSTCLELHIGIHNIVLETIVFRKGVGAKSTEEKKYRAAIIIDDFGFNKVALEKFLTLPASLTFAILPGERWSTVIAEKAVQTGHEILLHQPMEPHGYPEIQVGKRAILKEMNRAEIRNMLEKNFKDIPGAIGLNNHMGSKVTEMSEIMKEVSVYLKERNLLFIDSFTSEKSVAYKTAKMAKVRTTRNQVFLDNEDSQEAIEKQLEKLAAVARRHGRAVAIGHADRKYIVPALQKKLPEFENAGIEIVPISQFAE